MKFNCSHNLARRAATVALALALSAGPALWAPSVALADAQDDLEEAKERLSSLTEQLEEAESLVASTQAELADTQQKISDLEQQVADTSDKLEAGRAELSEQAASAYKSGGVSLVDIIFSSGTFDELVSQLYYAEKVSAAESEQLAAVRELQDGLASQKQELSDKESELEELLDQQTSGQRDLESSVSEARSYMDGLSAEVQQQLEAERAAVAAATGGGTSSDGSASAPAADASSDQDQQPQAPSGGQGGTGGGTSTLTPSTGGGSTGGGSLGSSARSTIVSSALSQRGVAYDYGAMSPGVAFDCSGLTTWAYSCAGISISRTSYGQYDAVKRAGNLKTSQSALVAGDLVFYGSGGSASHVGIYIGGGQMVHASDYGVGVIVSNLSYRSGFLGGGSPM